MLPSLHRLGLFITTTVLISEVFAEYNCPKGWFGRPCRYQYHCPPNTEDLPSNNGNCPGDVCEDGWFGPQCQYRSIPLWQMIDGNARPLPLTGYQWGPRETDKVTIKLGKTVLLTWIRLKFSNGSEGLDRRILVNPMADVNGQTNSSCTEFQQVESSENMVDILCPTDSPVTYIHMEGKRIRKLYTVYVSGGRNVALKQKTAQSSKFWIWVSSKAVDGNRAPTNASDEVYAATCSHTLHDGRQWWRLTFTRPFRVDQISVYNRWDPHRADWPVNCCRERIMGFNLKTLTAGKKTNFDYRDTHSEAKKVYEIVPDSRIPTPVGFVLIELFNEYLTLCEVEVYGDSVCPSNKYGRDCDKQCNCRDPSEATKGTRQCLVSTGGCPSGCKPGFTGENCWTPCPKGWFGLDCSSQCSVHCAGADHSCDAITGSCELGCELGYYGPLCDSQNCPSGWFGPYCIYKYHCPPNTEDNQMINGNCPDDVCEDGWFGPQCQYKSITRWQMIDGQARTLPLTGSQWAPRETDKVTIKLGKTVLLNWIRLKFTDDAKGLDRQILVSPMADVNGQSNSSCTEFQQVESSENMVDILCPTDSPVTYIHMEGKRIRKLYTAYVSGGRNVALQQTADQSSIYKTWIAEKAVDGNRAYSDAPESVFANTCSHTDGSPSTSRLQVLEWWKLHFTRSVRVDRISIYNRWDPSLPHGCCRQRLIGFNLQTLAEDLHVNFNYTDTHREAKQIYDIVPDTRIPTPVGTVEIRLKHRHLTLCEVEVYGDSVCPANKYGRVCENQCNCRDPSEEKGGTRQCLVSTGGCPSGCKPGFTGEDCWTPCPRGRFGLDCSGKCSVHCAGDDHSCEVTTGSCDQGCEVGYHGPLCDSRCPEGRHGSNCSQTCPVTCAGPDGPCHHVHGSCDQGCKPGYLGRRCDEVCPNGNYGLGCNKTCSSHCAGTGHSCDPIDGSCDHGCEAGYINLQCDAACASGTYGPACTKRCSDYCATPEKSCNYRDGSCDQGCLPGYRGVRCDTVCPRGTFGPGCNQACSSHCVGEQDACDHTDGSCDLGCETGYVGDKCDMVCPTGLFGTNCTAECNTHCAGPNNACNHSDGSCDLGCEPGYLGSYCDTECPPKTFGEDCNRTCSATCLSQLCDHVTGVCDGCVLGRAGDFCHLEIPLPEASKEKLESHSSELPIGLGIFAAVLVVTGAIVAAYLIHRKRKQAVQRTIAEGHVTETAVVFNYTQLQAGDSDPMAGQALDSS